MKKYAKINDVEKGIIEVASGDPSEVWYEEIDTDGVKLIHYLSEFYEAIGMELMDVEEGHDGNWYLAGKVPPPPETKEVRTFSKFGIWVATRNLPIAPGSEFTVWETFETFLSEQKLMSGWAQLVDLVEDNPFFEEFYPKAVETFGKELVDNVLAASVVGTKTVIVEG